MYKNTPHLNAQAELHFLCINLRCAKIALAAANTEKGSESRKRALIQLNKARGYLRQAMNDAEKLIYGERRAVLKRAEKLPTMQVRHIPGSRVPALLQTQAV